MMVALEHVSPLLQIMGRVFLGIYVQFRRVEHDTLPETNIAPEDRPPQKESSLPTINFQGLC